MPDTPLWLVLYAVLAGGTLCALMVWCACHVGKVTQECFDEAQADDPVLAGAARVVLAARRAEQDAAGVLLLRAHHYPAYQRPVCAYCYGDHETDQCEFQRGVKGAAGPCRREPRKCCSLEVTL